MYSTTTVFLPQEKDLDGDEVTELTVAAPSPVRSVSPLATFSCELPDCNSVSSCVAYICDETERGDWEFKEYIYKNIQTCLIVKKCHTLRQ